MGQLDRAQYVFLFSLHVRGQLAQAFLHRGIKPTLEETDMLSGIKEITMRDLASMAFRLDCRPIFDLIPVREEVSA